MHVEDNINIIPVDKDTVNKNGIKPLQTGNSWLYQTKIYDSTGAMVDSFIFADSVLKDTVIDKANWFRTSHFVDFWQTNAADGLRFRQYKTGQALLEWLEVKYPGSPGFTWQSNSSQRTVASTDTLINVTAGTYSCYYYTGIAFDSSVGWEYSNIFYSAKTGLIKSETYREKAGKVRYLAISVELIIFKKK